MAGRGDVVAAAGDRRDEHGRRGTRRSRPRRRPACRPRPAGGLVLGIGRGDSALAYIGLAPAPVAQFEHYLRATAGLPAPRRGSLRPRHRRHGRTAVVGVARRWTAGRRSAGCAGSATTAEGARRRRRVRAQGDRGRRPPRRRHDVRRRRRSRSPRAGPSSTAVAARAGAGLDVDGFGLGTYVPLFVHDDRAIARRMISGGVGSFARFSVMHGTVAGPVAESASAAARRRSTAPTT